MPTAYSPLLGLALPVTGELAGTWGDTVNNYITTYLDSSVAGTQTISGSQTAVTLSVTNGTTLTQVGSGATGSAQYNIINCTGNPASLLTITAPAQSKTYLIINATSTSQSVKIVGTGPTTGVTLIAGEKALVAWNGSDFIKVATTAAAGGSNTQVQFNNNGVLAGSANMTFNGTRLSVADFADASLTSGRVTYAGAGGNLTDSANLLFDGTTLTANALTTTSTVTINGGTANGVAYLNGSKVLTTGSALSFNGTSLTVGSGSGNPFARINGGTTAGQGGGYAIDRNGTEIGGVYSGSWYTSGSAAVNTVALGTTTAEALLFGINYTEQMRLTSTGLGIGTSSPATKLHVASPGNNYIVSHNTAGSTSALLLGAESGQNTIYSWTTVAGSTGRPLAFYTGPIEAMRLDTSGNLGLGVTPSAWSASAKALQITNYGAALSSFGGGATWSSLTHNAWFDGTNWKYTASSVGAALYQTTGSNAGSTHSWSVAAGGTAGNTISFTQAMTLDASGNLGVGVTSPATRLEVNGASEGEYFRAGGGTISARSLQFSSFTVSGVVGVGHQINVPNAFGVLTFATGSTERARITAGGNLLVGSNGDGDTGFRLQVHRGGGIQVTDLGQTGSQLILGLGTLTAGRPFVGTNTNSNPLEIGTRANTDTIFVTNSTERARITSDGDFLVGTTSQTLGTARLSVSSSGLTVVSRSTTSTESPYASFNSATSGNNQFMWFYTGDAGQTFRGSIEFNRGAGLVVYNTTSDYRAKDIIGPVQNTGATIDALKVYEGVMKGATQSRPMMIAHEAQEVVPFCVSGVKDETKEDGTPKYQQMDHASLVPLLIAEIQSLRARVAQLEAK